MRSEGDTRECKSQEEKSASPDESFEEFVLRKHSGKTLFQVFGDERRQIHRDAAGRAQL